MKHNLSRRWWNRKRILFPLTLLVALAVTSLIAYVRADASTIVIYNETGYPLPPLLVRACGQTRTFAALANRESVRIHLKSGGSESAVHLELGNRPPWQWDGPLIKTHGGYRVSIRLWPNHQVEAYTAVSWWSSIFN